MSENLDAASRMSFRDPGGALFHHRGRIFRMVGGEAQGDLRAFLRSHAARKLTDAGQIVQTWQVPRKDPVIVPEAIASRLAMGENGHLQLFEHQRIPFVSYPYEWAPEMLYAAAELTLQLAEQIQSDGFGLKDATPYNILFVGPNPIFIDILSFEKRDPRDATWLPYAQFVRTFLLPLQASRLLGDHLNHLLMVRRDGLQPEELYRWLSPLRRLLPPYLTAVTLPTWLAATHRSEDTSIYRKRLSRNPEQAGFVLRSLFRGLRRSLVRSRPDTRKSNWSQYMDSPGTYTAESFRLKESFVQEALKEFMPKAVLDVGCNTGHFSILSARQGARVVAIDYDPVVVGRVWQAVRSEGLDVLPLVVDITRPTPALGWRNGEHASFLERASGSFDLMLMLAVIHHMLVTERVPLPEILGLASELTDRLAIIEYVDRTDTMFCRLTRGRGHLHADFTKEHFEAACNERFEILRSQPLLTRHLYLLKKKKSSRS